MDVVRAVNVRREFATGGSKVEVLRGVNLVISRGEFLALLGPSGSGKSTLMHILGLLDTPTSGDVALEGREVGGLSASERAYLRRHRIGFVFQAFNLLSNLTVLQNVQLPMRLAGVPARERQKRSEQLLARVSLTERSRYHPDQLSGGERQRVAIARALSNHPALVLADEPTGNLDSEATGEVVDLLSDARGDGATVLVVTHNPEVAGAADRVLRMRDGVLTEER